MITYYDKAGNEVKYKWITYSLGPDKPRTQLHLVFKENKRDKYGNLIYQVANRIEELDPEKKGTDVGIYEKKIIEYEYYE